MSESESSSTEIATESSSLASESEHSSTENDSVYDFSAFEEGTTSYQRFQGLLNTMTTVSHTLLGSIPPPIRRTRRAAVCFDREAGHNMLMADYFAERPNFDATKFRNRYRMQKELFMKIVGDVQAAFPYFNLSWDHRGRRGFTTLQKCTGAIRMLAYGTCADSFAEYLKMSESMVRKCMFMFCKAVVRLYGDIYLRKPTHADIQRIYALHESRHGFPGMLGSLDCTHWDWEQCPIAWRGQYMRGDHDKPSVMLEAVATQDLWIWHAYFGPPGSQNDINVLNGSPIFNDLKNGTAPECPIVVNGVEYKMGYYLVDGIYPEFANLVKSFTAPVDPKRKYFKDKQESARKDIERAFGVLKKRWKIIGTAARTRKVKKLSYIMYAGIILHNMILEHEGRANYPYDGAVPEAPTGPPDPAVVEANINAIRNRQTHHDLRSDLVEHLWNNNPNRDP